MKSEIWLTEFCVKQWVLKLSAPVRKLFYSNEPNKYAISHKGMGYHCSLAWVYNNCSFHTRIRINWMNEWLQTVRIKLTETVRPEVHRNLLYDIQYRKYIVCECVCVNIHVHVYVSMSMHVYVHVFSWLTLSVCVCVCVHKILQYINSILTLR